MSAHGTGAYAPHRSDNAFIRTVGVISSVCGWIAAALIVVSVLVTCQMIFVRFVLRESTIWQTEAVIYMMIAATLLGLPYVQRLRGHVNVDLLPLLVPASFRRALAFLVLGASIAVIGVMIWHGWHMFHLAWERGWRSDTVWGVRLWIPYLAVPVGLGLLGLQLTADLLSVAIGEEKPFGLADHETLRSQGKAVAASHDIGSDTGRDMADATTGEPMASPERSDRRDFAPPAPVSSVNPPRFSRARGTRRTDNL